MSIKGLEKKFGNGLVLPFSDIEYPEVKTVSTGSVELDYAIGGRQKPLGVPLGRLTALWGENGCGKTTLCQSIVSEAQTNGFTVAWIDSESSFDPEYAKVCGIDLEKLLFINTYDENGISFCAEEIWEIAEGLARSEDVDIIILDSLDATVPKAELDGEYGESHPGLKARLNSQAMRKLAGVLFTNDTALVVTNHRHYKIGTMFGRSTTMSGGETYKHTLSLRIDMYRSTKRKKAGGETQGFKVRCIIEKNKISPAHKQAEIQIELGFGLCKELELIELGANLGIFKKGGAYYYFTNPETHDAHGKDNAIEFLRNHPDVFRELNKRLRSLYKQEEEECNPNTSNEPD